MIARHLVLPVLAVCLAQGTCVALNMYINPFIASYLLSLGVDPRQVSTYVGVMEGLEALTEVCMIHFHVLAIDWIPHRLLSVLTILIPGLIAGSFGLATHPWQLAVMRCLMGVFGVGGMQAIILGEVTNPESSSQAFGWLTIAGSIGVMSGAGLSGYLAEPAGRVPIFGDIELFKQKPYLLPGLTIAFVGLLAALAVSFTVPETNSIHKVENVDDDSGSVKVKLSYRRLASSSVFRSFLRVNFFHKMTFFGCMALLSSAGKLSPDLGGIGMTLPQIGRVLAITPIPIMLFILLFSTKVTKRYSPRQIVVTSALGGILAALYFPIANYWVIHTTQPLVYVDLLWYTSQILGRIWWTMQMIIMLKLYPQAHHRGRATLVSKQTTNLANAIGAPLYGRTFGFSSHYDAGSLGRQTIWIFGGLVAIMAIIASVMLPEITKPDPITEVDKEPEDEERQRLLDNRH